MRDIRFRAWDKENKKWLSNNKELITLMSFDQTPSDSYFEGESELSRILNIYPRKDTVLMQYTGLKDKNGVEIYEGDIVKNKNNDILKIVFDEDFVGFKGVVIDEGIECENYFITKHTEGIEVIGNIYENKENK